MADLGVIGNNTGTMPSRVAFYFLGAIGKATITVPRRVHQTYFFPVGVARKNDGPQGPLPALVGRAEGAGVPPDTRPIFSAQGGGVSIF